MGDDDFLLGTHSHLWRQLAVERARGDAERDERVERDDGEAVQRVAH